MVGDRINDAPALAQADIGITIRMIEIPASTEATIVNYAEEEKVDLIVVGTRGRIGFFKEAYLKKRYRCCHSCY